MPDYKENYPHGIMFHRIHGEGSHHASISQDLLEIIINKIDKNRIISPQSWIEKCENNNLRDTDICFTFDDGLKCQYKFALPVLDKYNIKAFFFFHTKNFRNQYDYNELFLNLIYKNYSSFDNFYDRFERSLNIDNKLYDTNEYIKFYDDLSRKFDGYSENEIKYRYLRNIYFSENDFNNKMMNFLSLNNSDHSYIDKIWMNQQDIQSLHKNGHSIGLHSHNHHLNFNDLSFYTQKDEYKVNKDILESIIDDKIKTASHPLGKYNDDTLIILQSLGIICSFRSNNFIPKNKDKINPTIYEIARNDVYNLINN